ncbi:MAG: YihY/virulence factor BrkB family protein [Candidatus Spyradosoma sp.]
MSDSPNTPNAVPAKKPSRLAAWCAARKNSFEKFYERVWTPTEAAHHSLPMRVFTAIWRVVEITVNGTIDNNIPMHAAALTYYALMALAPFVMLVLTIFGIVMNVRGEEAVRIMQDRIAETMQLVLPSPPPAGTPEAAADALAEAAAAPSPEATIGGVAPQLEEFAGLLLKNTMANSGSSGTIGTLVLVVLAVFMIARVEDAYNLIWNVKARRSWARRFWVYFLFLLLGGVFSAISMSVLSVSAILKNLSEHTNDVAAWFAAVPNGEVFFDVMTSFVPGLFAFAVTTVLFASLNRYLPKTNVNWGPALLGGATVAAAFAACGKAASLFVSKISEFNSIYGNLSVIFILMFGLYLSWMFLLVGGQISYAAQNAGTYRNVSRQWAELSPRSKRQALFACLFAIFARGSRRGVGPTLEELCETICIPATFASECVGTLTELKLISALAPEMDPDGKTRYVAAGTLNRITVAELREKFDTIRKKIRLGGDAELHAALEKFSASFETAEDSVALESLLRA